MNKSNIALILLVEDNAGEARLAQEALKEGDICNELVIVSDGVQAADFVFKRNQYSDAPTPDLILLDINLPKKNGHEVLKEIKNHEEYRKIPVVMLSNSRDEEDIVKAYNLYANCYISKPLDFDQFTEAIKSVKEFWLSTVHLPLIEKNNQSKSKNKI
jgi:two-component system, chemotaxis family, response regulator Rcp1